MVNGQIDPYHFGQHVLSDELELELDKIPSFEEMTSLKNIRENILACKEMVPEKMRNLLFQLSDTFFDLMIGFMRNQFMVCSDYKLFDSLFTEKMEVIKTLAFRRLVEYVSMLFSYQKRWAISPLLNIYTNAISVLSASAILLMHRPEVGKQNGRFVYQCYVEKLADYFYKFGKYEENTIVFPQFVVESSLQCEQLSLELERNIAVNISVMGLGKVTSPESLYGYLLF